MSETKAPPELHDELKFNTMPNIITLIRMGFVPVVVAMLFVRDPTWNVAAALLFGAASLTDLLDGYLARVRKEETVYGKLLDPLADKFLVVSALIMLQYLGLIHPVIVILLICREMAITGLRALASAEGLIIGASGSAKIKTTTQMVAIPFIMGKSLFGIDLVRAGEVLLYISLAISLWSAKDYIMDFFIAVREKRLAARAARLEAKAKRNQSS
ncbi:CDP-diacylglycerol--glycerol-3-phosphate 3-phosphatidyltransferase [Bdellovibrionota bacterium FG-2]